MAGRPRLPRQSFTLICAVLLLVVSGLAIGRGSSVNASGSAPVRALNSRAADCKPGTTKKIAFMLKQQTAFRYLHADVPFFKQTAEAAGYEVIVQSADND